MISDCVAIVPIGVAIGALWVSVSFGLMLVFPFVIGINGIAFQKLEGSVLVFTLIDGLVEALVCGGVFFVF